MKNIKLLTAMLLFASLIGCGFDNAVINNEDVTTNQAIELLQTGNSDYIKGKSNNHTTQALRTELTANGQHPYAVVITCSDSRVPVEEVFSCNAGDIFVIRTAGNVIGDLEMGSIEYGAEHCGAPLILVLGHTNCGAVTAAAEGASEDNYIASIIDQIEPAIVEAKKLADSQEDVISEGVRINVLNDVSKIEGDETISHLIKEGEVKVMGAIYNIETGEVQWL